jgi:fused signal recognition particle receptor
MFGFLKDKLKKAVQVFTKATTEDEKEKTPPPVAEKTPPEKKLPTPTAKKPSPEPVAEKKPAPKAIPAKPAAKPESKQTPAKPAPTSKPVEKPIKAPDAKPAVSEAPSPQQAAVEHIPKPPPAIERKLSAADLLAEVTDEEDEMLPEELAEYARAEPKPVQSTPPKPVAPTPQPKPAPTPSEPVLKVERKEESTGFFCKLKAAVSSKKLSQEEFDNLFAEMEINLLENNVALDVVDKIRSDLWAGLSEERFSRFSPEKRVQQALQESLASLFLEPYDILAAAKAKPKGEPYIICAVGVNGSGKTTTMGKLAYYFKAQGLTPVLAAGDTFRAAAIQQLEEHAKRVGVPIIKQQYGADAAAVAFDAIAYAKAHGHRVVLIDTAGRLHSNTNLMAELQKIVRVAKPDTTIFIGEATTGNDCVEQALEFQKAVDINGIVLSKVDVDERGGAALSISYVTRRPILFFGTGQTYDDLVPFDKEKVLSSLVDE